MLKVSGRMFRLRIDPILREGRPSGVVIFSLSPAKARAAITGLGWRAP
jgi:hypothetical protein